MIQFKKNSVTFSSMVFPKILIYGYGKGIKIQYLANHQTSPTTITLTTSYNESEPIRDYKIRFMDVQGNILEKEIESSIRLMCNIICNFTGELNGNSISEGVIKNFYKELSNIIEGTSFKRKSDLLDFDDPETWKKSENPEAKCNMEYLEHIKHIREIDDTIKTPPAKILEYPLTPEQCFKDE